MERRSSHWSQSTIHQKRIVHSKYAVGFPASRSPEREPYEDDASLRVEEPLGISHRVRLVP